MPSRALPALAAACAFATAALSAGAPARAGIVDAIVMGGPSAVPACDDPGVIETIRGKFAHADAHVLKRGVSLAAVTKVRQSYLGRIDGSPIVRRFCHAAAHVTDRHRPSTLYYLIEQDYGFVGVTWNVEFCIAGYEPWFVHDGNCRTVRKWW